MKDSIKIRHCNMGVNLVAFFLVTSFRMLLVVTSQKEFKLTSQDFLRCMYPSLNTWAKLHPRKKVFFHLRFFLCILKTGLTGNNRMRHFVKYICRSHPFNPYREKKLLLIRWSKTWSTHGEIKSLIQESLLIPT